MRRILICLVLGLSSYKATPQQTGTFSQYIFNKGILNPAYTGSSGCTEVTFTDRHQLVGFGGGPMLQTLSIYHSLPSDMASKHGLGANIMNDWNGPYKSLAGELIYAFHFKLSRYSNIMMGLGLSAMVRQETIDERGFSNIPDPVVTRGVERQLKGNAATGAYIYNDQFFLGFSAYNLIPGIPLKVGRTYIAYGGYNFGNPRKNWLYQPSLFFESNQLMDITDVTQKLIYREKYWFGVKFRKFFTDVQASSQNMLLFIGTDIGDWCFGYAFDLGINKLQTHHVGGHLFKVGYTICTDAFTCPAY